DFCQRAGFGITDASHGHDQRHDFGACPAGSYYCRDGAGLARCPLLYNQRRQQAAGRLENGLGPCLARAAGSCPLCSAILPGHLALKADVTAQIDTSPCPCPVWLPGSHLQTLYGALVARYHHIAFVRERVDTPDGDFLDFDWTAPGLFSDRLANGKMSSPDQRLAHTAARRWMQPEDDAAFAANEGAPALVLFHGLEGSSRSHYAP